MAKIYWRNGWAWARATVKGVEHRHPLETTSKREAEERFQQWIGALREDNSRWAKGETKYEDAVRKFTDDHLPNLEPSSQTRYLVSLLALSPHFERKTLQGIGTADFMTFVAARRKEKVTDSTIRRDLACLSSVFTVAGDYGLCDVNQVLSFLRTMKRRGALKDSPPRERYLSHEEEAAILRLARAKFDAARVKIVQDGGTLNARALTKLMILAAVTVAIDTGLRDEEQLRIRWPQVDLERDQVFIPGDKAKSGRDRWVPLLPRAKAILSALPRHKECDLVFWHRNGVGFDDLNHTLQDLAAQAGIVDEQAERACVKKRTAKGRKASSDKRLLRPATGIRWHDLRKTCGCRLLQDHKMPIEQVSLWLGHASVVQTQRAYAFLKAEQLHESVGTSRTNLGTIDAKAELKTVALIGKITWRAEKS